MKTFGFIGIGLHVENKWLALSMRVDEEVSIPEGITPPSNKGMMMRIPKKLGNGPIFLSGVIWCDTMEEGNACLNAFATKVESGELSDFGKEINPTEIFGQN